MKRRILCALLAGLLVFACVGCQVKPKNVIKTNGKARIVSLAVDYRHDPVGIDSATPLFLAGTGVGQGRQKLPFRRGSVL